MAKLFNQAALRILRLRGFRLRKFRYRKSPVYYLEGGNKKGPSIAILPGFGDTVYSWTEFMLRYSKHCRIYALDFPGYTGMSPRPQDGSSLSFNDQEKVAKQFLERVGGSVDYLIGNSMGGWLGMRLAARKRIKIGHLIGVNPAGIFTTEEEYLRIQSLFGVKNYTEFLKLMRHIWHKIPFYFYPFSLLGFYQHVKKPEFPKLLSSITPKHFVNHLLPKFRIPVSIIWGTEDKLFGEHMAKLLIELTPNATYYPVPRCGHMPQLEKSREFFKILDGILLNPAPANSSWHLQRLVTRFRSGARV